MGAESVGISIIPLAKKYQRGPSDRLEVAPYRDYESLVYHIVSVINALSVPWIYLTFRVFAFRTLSMVPAPTMYPA
jgi:hypothetical protein